MKNYLDHEVNVKYMDGVLSRSRDWDWFLVYLQENFNLEEASSWSEFYSRMRSIVDVYNYMLKIQEVSTIDYNQITIPSLLDIVHIASFFLGQELCTECENNIKTNIGKLLFLIVWITKLEKMDNPDFDYTYDMRLLLSRNQWEIMNITTIGLNEDSIREYVEGLEIEGIEGVFACLMDNIEERFYPAREDFIASNKDMLCSVNAFFYNRPSMTTMTWEEDYLLNMVNVELKNKEIQPAFVMGNKRYPDPEDWTEEKIDKMQNYFNNETADFVIETIKYVKYASAPSISTLEKHCLLLSAAVDELKPFELLNSSSYIFMSYIFEDKETRSLLSDSIIYVEMIKRFQQIYDPEILVQLSESKYPLGKKQRIILNSFLNEQYRQIDNVETDYELLNYLENESVAKQINTEYVIKVAAKFRKHIVDFNNIIVANIFYEYMAFLLRVNATSINVDRKIVQIEIIAVQKMWQDDYYARQKDSLKTFSYETQIPNSEIKKCNDIIVKNPMAFAKECMIVTDNEMCSVMESASENAILHMVTQIIIAPLYPVKKNHFDYARHDIDRKLKDIVERIVNEKGYRFMNQLDTDAYVKELHVRYRFNVSMGLNMFYDVESVYTFIREWSPIDLLSWDDNESFAFLTEMFPTLEIAIRELAKEIGFVPFKESLDAFMEYKDPSSILREIIIAIYDEVGSFENIPDLLFVYHFMYNNNSMNIRNEAIHGRDYLSGASLGMAKKITIISIYLILKRLELIKDNTQR